MHNQNSTVNYLVGVVKGKVWHEIDIVVLMLPHLHDFRGMHAVYYLFIDLSRDVAFIQEIII